MPLPENRALGAFLGLALGDSYGRELEFIGSNAVYTAPVSLTPGCFRPTDDTFMSLYLAKAVLETDSYSDDAFGSAVGRQFAAWYHDPITPTTAPGMTCLRGIRTWIETGDWRTCGVPESDGCGAVMRVCPLPLRYSGETLTAAARVSALVTHRHPNALDAAVVASQLLRRVLETGEVGPELVWEVANQASTASVRSALEAAIVQSQAPSDWLNESAIPDGDGGWRSPSALGLAIYALLLFQHQGFEVVIDKAARIHGDSDSVACLAGMFYGAAHGVEALPSRWLDLLTEGAEIGRVVQQLLR